MPIMNVQRIEPKTERRKSPGGLDMGEALSTEPCEPCLALSPRDARREREKDPRYAAVLMTDGPDRVTLESAAGMDKWWFGMYGSRNLGQTFVVKTGEQFQLLHVNELDDFAQASPALVGERLLIRTEHRLYSIRRKA